MQTLRISVPMSQTILVGIKQWMTNTTPKFADIVNVPNLPISHLDQILPLLRIAFQEQTSIGWDNFLKVRLCFCPGSLHMTNIATFIDSYPSISPHLPFQNSSDLPSSKCYKSGNIIMQLFRGLPMKRTLSFKLWKLTITFNDIIKPNIVSLPWINKFFSQFLCKQSLANRYATSIIGLLSAPIV